MSVHNDIGLIKNASPVIKSGNWLESTNVEIARHRWQKKLIIGAAVGLHKACVCTVIASVRHAL